MVNQTILPRVKLPKSLNPRIAGYHIEAQTPIIAFGKIEAEAEKLGLDTSKLDKIKITGNNGSVCGTDRAKSSSIVRYEHVWSGLLDWSIANNS
jgi:hypothetical protein